jgi:hypothetical protein
MISMNLGDVFLKAAASICIASGVLTVVLMLGLRLLKKVRWPRLLLLALPTAILLCCCGLYLGHRPLFVAWHRAQNDALPRTGCLTYKPDFFRLYASYRMTRPEFDAWVGLHPWKLLPGGNSGFLDDDLKRCGIKKAEAAFATEMAPNGSQLRVYYHDGVMHALYFVM